MNLIKLRGLLAAPLASLILILILCVFVARRPQPAFGLRVPMVKLKQHSPGYVCEDDRLLIVRLMKDGNVWINETAISTEQLRPLLFKIFEYRHERVVYLFAEPSVPYGKFVEFFGQVSSSISGLHVILLTDEILKSPYRLVGVVDPSRLEVYVPECDLEWSENGFNAPSMSDPDVVPPR